VATSSTLITQEHKKSIDESIKKLQSAKKEIDMAERAGLTQGADGSKLSDAKTQVDGLLGRLTQIKNVYFPNG